MTTPSNSLATLLADRQSDLLEEWLKELNEAGLGGLSSSADVRRQATELLKLLGESSRGSAMTEALQAFLREFSDARVREGYTSAQTATFVFGLKRTLFRRVQSEFANDPASLARITWEASEAVDALGLKTIDAYQKSREAVIQRQQEELLELSTPVVKLWDGVLALPIIGTLDSARTQVVMESLLERIANSESEIAIIDITGVPTVDTLVAQHLIKTVTAIRLMGADCIISGVRPQIAQTIVHLGVDLGSVTTKANLADALQLAMKRVGVSVTRRAAT